MIQRGITVQVGLEYATVKQRGKLTYYHQLEHERIHLLLIEEAGKGLEDVAAGLLKIKRRRPLRISRGS